jgi:RNA polymerase sigma factor (sigma-70 family)
MAMHNITAIETEQMRHTRIFEREFCPLMDAVCTFALRLTNDISRADDLAQETFLKAWRFMDRYAEGTNAKAWLFRICRNAFINEYRSQGRQPQRVVYEDVFIRHQEDEPSSTRYLDLYEEMGDSQLGDEVTRALESLRPEFRVVVLLDLEGFTYEEIATIAEIPIGTVRSRLHRARNVLAGRLREYAEEHGYGAADEAPKALDNDDTPSVAA